MAALTLFVGTYTRMEGHVPDGKGEGIYAFEFQPADGSLKKLGVTTEGAGVNPTFLAVTDTAVYTINECNEPSKADASKETGYAAAFARDPKEPSKLTFLNRVETHGTFPCHAALSPNGDFLSAANYGGGCVTLFPINKEGSLAEASDVQQFATGSLAVPDRQEAPHVHSTMWATTDNAAAPVLFVADLGRDRVGQYTLDTAAKKLVQTTDDIVAVPASGPRHMAVHTGINAVYVLDELSNTVNVHSYDKKTGTISTSALQRLSTLPEGYSGNALCADIHISSCGKFLYASNRFHDTIAMFRIDLEAQGTLEAIGHESTRGKTPRNFLIYEQFMLVANQDSHSIEVFHIDAVSGGLVYTGTSVECYSPVSLVFAP